MLRSASSWAPVSGGLSGSPSGFQFGDAVRFAQTDLADAQMRYLERERAMAKLETWIHTRLRQPW